MRETIVYAVGPVGSLPHNPELRTNDEAEAMEFARQREAEGIRVEIACRNEDPELPNPTMWEAVYTSP